jgi:vitamin B12 transporter
VAGRQALGATGLAVFGKYATAYAPPSAQDLYYPGFSNPGLLPEESRGWEAGARWSFLEGAAQASAVYFRSRLENYIEFVWGFADGISTGRPENVAEARLSGVEVAGEIRVGPFNSFASYTWLEAEDLAGARLLRRPRHQASAGATFRPSETWSIGLEGNWVYGREDTSGETFARIDAEDYFVARLTGRYRMSPRFELFGRVENLFDQRYEEVHGYPALGRGFYAGARASF